MEDIREHFLKIAIELDEKKPFQEDAFNFFFRNPKGYDDDDVCLSNMYDKFDNYDSSSNYDICDDDIIYDSCSKNNQYESECESENESENETENAI